MNLSLFQLREVNVAFSEIYLMLISKILRKVLKFYGSLSTCSGVMKRVVNTRHTSKSIVR